jgi:hypothetical protein
MIHFKKHITFVFIFSFLLPLAIQVVHSFENHEHVVCKSVSDSHFHQKDVDCSSLHQILETYFGGFSIISPIISLSFYKNNFNKQSQQAKGVFSITKSPRGPPQTSCLTQKF